MRVPSPCLSFKKRLIISQVSEILNLYKLELKMEDLTRLIVKMLHVLESLNARGNKATTSNGTS